MFYDKPAYNKAAMCMLMLRYLSTGKVYKVAELAHLLHDTNPRNVIEYKKELEDAGYYIISIPGKNGGYKLDANNLLPVLKFNDGEKEALAEAVGYLSARNDFMYKDSLASAVSKVFSSMQRPRAEEEVTVINRFPLAMPKEQLERRYAAIKSCLPQHAGGYGAVFEMDYVNLSNEVKRRALHPYKIYMYNNAWYVLGFDEPSGEILYFKLNRIIDFTVTQRRFTVLRSYNERDYLDEFGMKNNGEWHAIQLRLTGNYARLANERIYGRNQNIDMIDGNTAVLSCEMQGKDNILHFVLGFGVFCEVLSPAWLKDEVKSIAEKLASYYKNNE